MATSEEKKPELTDEQLKRHREMLSQAILALIQKFEALTGYKVSEEAIQLFRDDAAQPEHIHLVIYR